MDYRLRELKARIVAREDIMNDPHRDDTGKDSRPPTGDDYNDLVNDVINVLTAIETGDHQESWGTLEGAEQYLTQQRNIAFLALYRLQDEPFMPKRMKADLEDQAIARCGDSGAALDVVRECLKLSRQPEEAESRL